MTPERAREINSRLVQAYLHQQSIRDDLPDLDDVSIAEALLAARLSMDLAPIVQADGSQRFHMRFDATESVVRSLLYAQFNKIRPANLTEAVPLEDTADA